MGIEVSGRIKDLRELMKKASIGVMVVSKTANVSYVTGFRGEDSWALVTDKKVFLLTDSRYTEQAEGECAGCEIIDRKGPMAKSIAEVLGGRKVKRRIAIEDELSIAAQKALHKELGVRLQACGGVIESLRQMKSKDEIILIAKAGKIATAALDEALEVVRVGMSEGELAGMINLNIRKRGLRESFETIVAFGANASRPHHLPGMKKLKKNDTILVDWGVRYENYCCDLTRCFGVGKVKAEYARIYNAVLQAQRAAILKVRAGVAISEIDEAARGVLRVYGRPIYGHGTGHGLGLEVHEGPVVSGKNKGKLRAGEVITIEPGVYIPGEWGVRIEDDVLVTNDGYEVLSPAAGELVKLIID